MLLKKIAQTIEKKYPKLEQIVLLVDERPEEVTDMKESLERSEVIYSTFDELRPITSRWRRWSSRERNAWRRKVRMW